jgi:hypothetical protein
MTEKRSSLNKKDGGHREENQQNAPFRTRAEERIEESALGPQNESGSPAHAEERKDDEDVENAAGQP